MNEKCCICLEDLILPVEFSCFSCHHNSQINCSSFSRVCMHCANQYLQLDMDPEKRDFYKKCLFCPHHAYLPSIRRKDAYRRDFALMVRSAAQRFLCPFCHEFQGEQLAIHHHTELECPDYHLECSCNKVLRRRDFYFHLFQCPDHSKCSKCSLYIQKTILNNHMREVHEHLSCPRCKVFVHIDSLDEHLLTYCPMREQICQFCLLMVPFKNYRGHLTTHLNNLQSELEQVSVSYKSLMEKYTQIVSLLRPFRNVLN